MGDRGRGLGSACWPAPACGLWPVAAHAGLAAVARIRASGRLGCKPEPPPPLRPKRRGPCARRRRRLWVPPVSAARRHVRRCCQAPRVVAAVRAPVRTFPFSSAPICACPHACRRCRPPVADRDAGRRARGWCSRRCRPPMALMRVPVMRRCRCWLGWRCRGRWRGRRWWGCGSGEDVADVVGGAVVRRGTHDCKET
jgi:hypothetical protein